MWNAEHGMRKDTDCRYYCSVFLDAGLLFTNSTLAFLHALNNLLYMSCFDGLKGFGSLFFYVLHSAFYVLSCPRMAVIS